LVINIQSIHDARSEKHQVKCAILANYWLWLPDDGFLVN